MSVEPECDYCYEYTKYRCKTLEEVLECSKNDYELKPCIRRKVNRESK